MLSVLSVPPLRVIENSNKIAKKIKKLKNTIMAFFRVKTGQKGREKENIKIIIPFRSNRTRYRKLKKIAKKFKDLKNTIMASFLAKIGWKRMRKRENKNYRYVSYQPDA